MMVVRKKKREAGREVFGDENAHRPRAQTVERHRLSQSTDHSKETKLLSFAHLFPVLSFKMWREKC